MEHVNPAHLQPRNDHERTDVRVSVVLIFVACMVVAALFIHLFIAWLFGFLERAHKAEGAPISIMADPRELPPVPRLQVAPQRDMQEFRAAEDAVLNGYGWADRQNGAVRIPIDRAMDLIAQRGLPAAAPPAKPAKPARTPNTGEPNAPAAR